jgi:hypothetical protein
LAQTEWISAIASLAKLGHHQPIKGKEENRMESITPDNIENYAPWPVNGVQCLEWEAKHGQRWTRKLAGWAAAVMNRQMEHEALTQIQCGFEKSPTMDFDTVAEMKAHIEARLAAGDWLTFYKHPITPTPTSGRKCVHWMNPESSWSAGASRRGLIF